MKKLFAAFVVAILIALALTSCSSEKQLQRRVERHGIKESIGFVTSKYPEYFKSKDTIIHDTLIRVDSIVVPQIDTTLILSDSSDFYHYRSDSLNIMINKLTGRLKMNIKPRTIYLHDTLYMAVPCPEIICPDCDDLKDNTKQGSSFKWWWLVVASVALAAFYIWINRNVNK
jgi:hypothetical protein